MILFSSSSFPNILLSLGIYVPFITSYHCDRVSLPGSPPLLALNNVRYVTIASRTSTYLWKSHMSYDSWQCLLMIEITKSLTILTESVDGIEAGIIALIFLLTVVSYTASANILFFSVRYMACHLSTYAASSSLSSFK